MASDPYRVLGIPSGSSEKEIRIAWREKLRTSHPDAGGVHDEAVHINQALVEALEILRRNSVTRSSPAPEGRFPRQAMRDVSSLTIDVLPVDCWHEIELVASQSGSILVEEPPYLIEFTMHDSGLEGSADLWCRCEMVPEAGATTVHISIGTIQGVSAPSIETVRDFLVNSLNELDWQN